MLSNYMVYVCVSVLMPNHCTITYFGYYAMQIDDISPGVYLIHAPLGQITLHVGMCICIYVLIEVRLE